MKIIRILFGLFRLSRAPEDYSRVEQFREVLRRYGYFTPGVRKVSSTAETKPVMDSKPLLDWDVAGLAKFKQLPKETLGYQFADFLEKNKISPLSYAKDSSLNEEEYYIRRVVQTHDLWHVVLGYPTDELGEIGINSFMLAQIGWPPAGFYIGGYVLRQMIKSPASVPEVVNVVSKGFSRGQVTKPLFAIPWENQFERPIADVRRDLGIA